MAREIRGITSRQSKTSQNIRGFTLIEVVVVMAIIAVLAALVVGAINVARNVAKETTHRSNAKTIQVALEAKYARDRRYNNVDEQIMYDLGGASVSLFSATVALAATPECNGTHWSHTSGPSFGTGLYSGGALQVYADSYTIYIADASCDYVLTETLRSQ